MSGQDHFTVEEFQSPNYRWKDPENKRTKFFVYSTHSYGDNKIPVERFNKTVVKHPDSGENEDVDVFRMRREFIVHHTLTKADAVYKENLTKNDFLKDLDTIKKDSTLKDYDCFFFMFFTFLGKDTVTENDSVIEEECLQFSDGFMAIHEIWEKVRDIELFRGKPKVFFIQADDYRLAYPPQIIGKVSFERRKIPIDADRLIIQSSIPGKITRKIETEASFLVEAFIEVMDENRRRPKSSQLDLLSLTTAINQNAKRKIEKFSKDMERAENFPYPQPEGDLIEDRMKSLQKRNIIEPIVRPIHLKKKNKKVKYVEKRKHREIQSSTDIEQHRQNLVKPR